MAAHALSIGAPAAATPHLALVALVAQANDPATCWTTDPRAAKLLASCAALPPVILEHRSRYGNAVERWTAYAGYRVEALEAIRMEIGERLLQAYHQHGDEAYAPFRQWCEQPNASDAVAALFASSTEH
jgi:hypothetical protein